MTTLLEGDCRERMKDLPDNSVDSIVTDSPYELGFMGKKWDRSGIAYDPAVWTQCLRVLKPGGYLLSFGGTRTYHRMVCAIEDAGFEIRDEVLWIYSTGFPKSLDISKAIDRLAPRVGMFDAFATHFLERLSASALSQKDVAAYFPSRTGGLTGCVWNWANGANVPTLKQWQVLQPLLGLSPEWLPLIERVEAEREVVGRREVPIGHAFAGPVYGGDSSSKGVDVTIPSTPAAKQWQGWGTALKPAHEPICLARKPLEGTVAANALKYGVGGLNIDGCRVGVDDGDSNIRVNPTKSNGLNSCFGIGDVSYARGPAVLGRFPANLITDGSEEVVKMFPQTGASRANLVDDERRNESGATWIGFGGRRDPSNSHNDFGGSAARFFYSAKASPQDRNEGLDVRNGHPTVKPVDLMCYLCRLITPKGGTVLDPFMGSGSTGKAAQMEGFNFIGIELDPEYFKIAKARIEDADNLFVPEKVMT